MTKTLKAQNPHRETHHLAMTFRIGDDNGLIAVKAKDKLENQKSINNANV